jgi:disulfide bond formation protein DsbB
MLVWLVAITAFFVAFPVLLNSTAQWNGQESRYIVDFNNDWYTLSGLLLNFAIILSKGFVIYLAISVVFFVYDLFLERKEMDI